jgi:hypothetical protein
MESAVELSFDLEAVGVKADTDVMLNKNRGNAFIFSM